MAFVDFNTTNGRGRIRVYYDYTYSNGDTISTFKITKITVLSNYNGYFNWYMDGKITVNGVEIARSSINTTSYWWIVNNANTEYEMKKTHPTTGKTFTYETTLSHNANGDATVTIGLEGNTYKYFWLYRSSGSVDNSQMATGGQYQEFVLNVPQRYTLTISKDAGSIISVTRTSSNVDSTGTLYNQDDIWSGDRLTISFGAQTGYTLSTHTVNGTAFTSGESVTVSRNVTVAATSEKNQYKLSISADSSSVVEVKSKSGTEYSDKSYIPYGTVVIITVTPKSGYSISSFTINGVTQTSESVQITVDKAITIIVTSGSSGYIYLDTGDGSGLNPYRVWIYTKSNGWNSYCPYLYTNLQWFICGGSGSSSGGGSSGGGEETPSGFSYTVDAISGAKYGFTMNANGYYESTNQGVDDSFAICRVNFVSDTEKSIIIRVINYAESGCDYGFIGSWDTALTLVDNLDSDVSWNGRHAHSSSPVDIAYIVPEGSHFLDVKFIKDFSDSAGNDSLQFMIIEGESGPGGDNTEVFEYSVDDISGVTYGFRLNSNGYYESQNFGVSTSFALCRVNFNCSVETKINVTFINYSQPSYDYGLIGNVDGTLARSIKADAAGSGSSNSSFRGGAASRHSSNPQTMSYTIPAGQHFLEFKYRKNNDNIHKNNDSFQFKIEKA